MKADLDRLKLEKDINSQLLKQVEAERDALLKQATGMYEGLRALLCIRFCQLNIMVFNCGPLLKILIQAQRLNRGKLSMAILCSFVFCYKVLIPDDHLCHAL